VNWLLSMLQAAVRHQNETKSARTTARAISFSKTLAVAVSISPRNNTTSHTARFLTGDGFSRSLSHELRVVALARPHAVNRFLLELHHGWRRERPSRRA